MLTYHQWGPVTITWGHFHKRWLNHQSLKLANIKISQEAIQLVVGTIVLILEYCCLFFSALLSLRDSRDFMYSWMICCSMILPVTDWMAHSQPGHWLRLHTHAAQYVWPQGITSIGVWDEEDWENVKSVHLTHWGRVTHVCVRKLTSIGSDNGLSPSRRQAIIWTNAGILSIGPLGTNFSEISIEIQIFSFKKMHLKMSSAKWRPFFLRLDVLITLLALKPEYFRRTMSIPLLLIAWLFLYIVRSSSVMVMTTPI